MKRKLTAIVLAIAMLVTMMPAMAMGADTTVTSNLQKAIDAATNGDTITLGADITEDITIPADKNITLNLGGYKLTNVDTNKKDTITVKYGGTLTIEGSGTVDNVSHGHCAVHNSGTVVLNGGTFERSQEAGVDAGNSGNNSYYTLVNHGVMTINKGVTVNLNGAFSSMIDNGYYNYNSDYVQGTNHANPSLTINGGTFDGGLNTIKNDDGGVLEINDGTFTNVAQNVVMNYNVATINGGTFANTSAKYLLANAYIDATIDKGELTINGGTFKSMGGLMTSGRTNTGKVIITGGQFAYDGTMFVYEPVSATISGGKFSSNPSAYLEEGKTTVSGEAPYLFFVTDKTENVAEVVPAAPTVEAALDAGTSQEDKDLAADAVNAINNNAAAATIDANAMASAASDVAYRNDVTVDEGKGALQNAGVTVNDQTPVNIVVQPFMDIQVTDAVAGESVTFDITQMYQTVATTADLDNGKPIITEDDSKNAVVIRKPQAFQEDAIKVAEVTLPLPDAIAKLATDGTMEVNHKDMYIYDGTVTTTGDENAQKSVLTFTTTNGFSPFKAPAQTVATIGEKKYPSVQAAVNAAKNGDTITVKEAGNHKVNMTGNSRKVNFAKDAGVTGDVIVIINGETVTVPGSYTYTAPTTPVETYDITIEASNGSVEATHKFAAKGATVTLTPKANEGYKLDFINVVPAADGGNKLELKALANGKYSFKMPAEDVIVHASFVPTGDEPAETVLPFADVNSGDWFYNDVVYVYDNGMMKGISDTAFGPQQTTTRAMIVTMLYRLEGEPTVDTNASFTDVTTGAYYEDAVAWAAANGIVTGYSDSEFAPNNAITREQMAAILYRYAQYKGIDTTEAEQTNILSYTDAANVSSYAKTPMQWAVGTGLIGGMTADTLAPQGQAVRAQVAAIMTRLCTNVLA